MWKEGQTKRKEKRKEERERSEKQSKNEMIKDIGVSSNGQKFSVPD